MRQKYASSKENAVQDRLHHKGIYCISTDWIKWSKRFLAKADRRQAKTKIIEAYDDML